jgi:hypothetical protein
MVQIMVLSWITGKYRLLGLQVNLGVNRSSPAVGGIQGVRKVLSKNWMDILGRFD